MNNEFQKVLKRALLKKKCYWQAGHRDIGYSEDFS